MKPVKFQILAPIALFLVLSTLTAFGEDVTRVRPTALMMKSYPKAIRFEVEAHASYPVTFESNRGFFITVRDAEDFILLVSKAAVVENGGRAQEGRISFEKSFTVVGDQGYLFFDPAKIYSVDLETETDYRIDYVVGETSRQFNVRKTDFVPKIERSLNRPQDAICVLEFDDGSAGSGFLFEMDDQLYCMTNQHVAATPARLRIKLIDGTELDHGQTEFASDRDLARILITTDTAAFKIVRAPELGEPITVLGNSFGAGRVTTLSGQVTGLNHWEVESTATFVSGNSGSPILAAGNEVVGVATLIEFFPGYESIAKGTVFEDGRRVGVRFDTPVEWVTVDMDRFGSRNRLILQTNAFVEELPEAMKAYLQTEPGRPISENYFKDPVIKQWIRNRNQQFSSIASRFTAQIEERMKTRGMLFYGSTEHSAMLGEFENEISSEMEKNWNTLLQRIRSKQRSNRSATPYPDTAFLNGQIDHCSKMLETAEAVILEIKAAIKH